MATAQIDTVIRHIRRAVLRQDAAGRTDEQLLASFIDQKDEAAFEALVRRHGSMVFGVCRRVVGNHHDAEDAFQATFLVLARKASSVRPREQVANWLHGVALRTAMKANTMTTKRRGREKQVTEMPEPEAPRQGQWLDLQPLLDQELNGLPENYRLPILLCDLEGKAIKEAAQQLGWPQGTLAGRLARGRKLLAKRLANRGVVLSAGSLAAFVTQNVASAGVPTSLMSSTVKAATLIAAGKATVAGVVPAKVAALLEGVLKAMLMSKLKGVTTVLLVLSLPLLGGGLWTTHSAVAQQATPTSQAKVKEHSQPLTLPTAEKAEHGENLTGTAPAVLDRKGSTVAKTTETAYRLIFIKTLGVMGEHFQQITYANQYEGRIEALAYGGDASGMSREGYVCLEYQDGKCLITVRINKVKTTTAEKSAVVGRDAELERVILTKLNAQQIQEDTQGQGFRGAGAELSIYSDTKDAKPTPYNRPAEKQSLPAPTRVADGAEKPPSRKADASKSLDEKKLHGEWMANENENCKISLIFGPGKTVRRIMENGHDDTGTYSVDWTKNPYHLDLNLIQDARLPVTTHTIMGFVEPGKLRIEIGGGGEASPEAFTDDTIVLTRKEKHPPGSKQATKDADRDIEIAEFYRRTGKFGSAHFYYQLVQIRYPGTNFSEKAKQGLEDLKKHRVRLLDGTEVWEAPKPPLQPPPPPQSLQPYSGPVPGTSVPPPPPPSQPLQPPPPPIIQEAPKASRDVLELRQQVKALESRLAALEGNAKPQPSGQQDQLRKTTPNLPTSHVALPAKAANQREYEIDDDLVKFQGTWSLVLHHWKGDELDDGPVTMTVKGDACTVVKEKGTKKATWRIKLDAAKQPKQIDFLGGGEKVPGIYKLEGNTLLICQGQSGMDRPRMFAAEGGDTLFVFRRLTPAIRANERPVKVGLIMIVGNTKTEDGAIRKKLRLRPGDALDYHALSTAKKNLVALNATITVIERGEDSDYKDIRVTVVEK